MKIEKLTSERLPDVNKPNQPFEIIGKLKVTFDNDKWSYTEELLEHPYMKSYPNDDCDYSDYIHNPDKIVFLAYIENKCIGQIVLRRDWNLYAFIEDICVSQSARGKGVGTALMQRAVEWAKESSLKGLALETQDNNVKACRFYVKCGFEIGSVNTMVYKNFEKPWSDEVMILWYLRF